MKILFVSHSFNSGGAEKCLDSLARYCHANGHQCLLVGPNDSPRRPVVDSPYELVMRIRFGCAHLFGPVTLVDYVKAAAKIFSNVWSISRLIQRTRPDVIFSNTSAVMAGGLSAKLLGVPHIWHIHENLDTFTLRFILPASLMKRAIAFLSDRVIFVSRLSMASVFPKGHPKAKVIYNGVSIPSAGEINLKYYDDPHGYGLRRIGFFGSSDYRKGLDVLMRAVSHLRNRYPDVTLDVWGRMDSKGYKPLRDLATRLGISENVQFHGFCDNVRKHLADYAIVAIPSRAEAFPLLALEVMAAAVPLVATRCGGPEELIVDGIDGFVVPVDDYYALANAIALSFSAPQESLEMAKRARDKVAANFVLSDKLQAILDEIQLACRQMDGSTPTVPVRR